jgi:predicted cupin superfamily sugar epimerase
VIRGGLWQAAEPIGEYALVGCTVAPGYEEEDETYLIDDQKTSNKLTNLRPELKRLI